MANVVLISDMVKGFCQKGDALYCGRAARDIIPNIQRLLQREMAAGSTILYVNDQHAPDDEEFKSLPQHCVVGSDEIEIIPELSQYPGETIPKTRYSAFYNTSLSQKLKQLKPDKLIICGVCTDICIMFTAADAMYRGYDIEIPVDCVASYDASAHQFALKHMQKLFGASLTALE
ncbi:cysteine hydrolase family protein [Chloroflexota bacterium]